MPEHIAFIMDGNGRWATSRGLKRSAGHYAGAETLDKVTRLCYKKGVKTVTFYAFSTENWRRPAEEVAALTNILTEYLKKMIGYFEEDSDEIYTHTRVRFIGDTKVFNLIQRNMIDKITRVSEKSEKKMEMNIDGTVMMDMILEPSTAHLQTNLKMDVFGQQQEYNMETYQFTQSDQLIAVSNDGSGWTRFEDSSELQNIAGFKDLFDYGLMSDLDPKVTGSDKINDKDVWCIQFTEGMEELLELLNSEELDTASKALLTSMGKSIKINCKVYIDKETNRYVKGVGEITGLNDFLSSLMSGATDADAKLTIDTFEITVDYDKYNEIKDIQIPQDAKDAVLTDSDSEQA